MKKQAAIWACIGGALLAWSDLVWRFVPAVDVRGMNLTAARLLFVAAREVPPLLLFLAGCGMLYWVSRIKRSRLWWFLLVVAALRGVVATAGLVQFIGSTESLRAVANDIWVFGWFPASLLLTSVAVIMLVEPLVSAPLEKRTRRVVAAWVVLAAVGTLLLGGPAPVIRSLTRLSLPLAAVLHPLGVPTLPVIYTSTALAVVVLWYLVIRTAFAFRQQRTSQEPPAGEGESFSAT